MHKGGLPSKHRQKPSTNRRNTVKKPSKPSTCKHIYKQHVVLNVLMLLLWLRKPQ